MKKTTMIQEDVTKAVTIPTNQEINDEFQAFQIDLSVREKHLTILPSFHLDDMEDLLKAISVKSINLS